MKKISLLLFLLLNLFSSFSKAVLTQLHILHNAKGEYVYLLGDYHLGNPRDDLLQLNYLTYLLGERELINKKKNSNPEPLDIFFESFGRQGNPCVMDHLSTFQECFNTASFYNIEVRVTQFIAHSITYPKINPYEISRKMDINGHKAKLGHITFNNLLEEFDTLFDNIKDYQEEEQFCEPVIFSGYLQKLEKKRAKLLQAIDERGFALSDLILDAAKKLFDKHGPLIREIKTDRFKFYKIIVETFSPLLELAILQRLTHSSTKEKIVIAGGGHILSLVNLLKAKGFYSRNLIYGKFKKFKGYPLEEEQLKSIISLPPKFPLSLLTWPSCTLF